MRLFSAFYLGFALLSFIVIFGNNVDAAELPLRIFSQLGGEWKVEVTSPCTFFTDGNVSFSNQSASLKWKDAKVNNLVTRITSGKEGVDTLSLDGLNPFLVNGKRSVSYKICEFQKNQLETLSRPLYGLDMMATELTQYSGVMDGNCDLANKRTIFIRTLGIPVEGKKVNALKQKDALQYVEVLVDIQKLPNTCFVAPAEGAEGNKPRRVKRRGLRTGSIESDSVDELSKNGLVSIRFSKKSPPRRTFFEKYKTSFTFMIVFLGFRLVNKVVQRKFSGK
ncbi:unnamed protein product [Phytomonas sp. EM1]|nr:unnamed protein product [Phytomonas sp. EM1]|eukprot:CCW61027.1 unnamed protein product [Phytomonas sp. isolate EM1]